jgi:hypothetical protein
MFSCDRIETRLPGRRATECPAPAILLGLVLLAPGMSFGEPPAPQDSPSATLALSVSETADAVLLRIRGSGDIEPGSLDVRFAGRKAVVLARDAKGRTVRSQRVQLPSAVVEDEASADYEADDTLVLTLRKDPDARASAPDEDEAALR